MAATTERPTLTAKDAEIIRTAGELKGWALVLDESENELLVELAATLDRLAKRLFDLV